MRGMRSRTSSIVWMLVCTLAACGSDMSNTGGGRGSRGNIPWMPTSQAGTTGTGAIPATGAMTDGVTPIPPADNPGSPVLVTPMMPTGAAGSGLKEGQCAKSDVSVMRIIPTVWLVLDGSGSMLAALGDKTRWDALREALMDPMMGVVKLLEKDVKFGMIMYDGPGAPNMGALPDGSIVTFSSGPPTTCPRLVSVEPARNNFEAINMAYPLDPLGGSTPTDKALDAVIQHLPNMANVGPDVMISPTAVVLATDGEPNDLCGGGGGFLGALGGGGVDVKGNVIRNVQTLAAAGNKTYVISLAGDDAGLNAHLQQVAQTGMTGKPPFVPASKEELIQVFRDIIGPGAACDIRLNGKVKMGSECKGKLQINGVDLPCDDPSGVGWVLKDESTISIVGSSCEMLKMSDAAVLHADFPCDIFVLN